MKVYNTSLPLPALQRLDRCLNALSSNLYRSVAPAQTIKCVSMVVTQTMQWSLVLMNVTRKCKVEPIEEAVCICWSETPGMHFRLFANIVD